ncbi:MAG: GreA/GreB family elongation factor, partial [Bilophila sp.]
EADYANGSISILSPVGQALLGKEVGDEITVNAPRGRINYEIVAIQFN